MLTMPNYKSRQRYAATRATGDPKLLPLSRSFAIMAQATKKRVKTCNGGKEVTHLQHALQAIDFYQEYFWR
jgi:hypothetical protein